MTKNSRNLINSIARLRQTLLIGLIVVFIIVSGIYFTSVGFKSYHAWCYLTLALLIVSFSKNVSAGDPERGIPATRGVTTVFWKKTDEVVNEGLQFFFPVLFGVVLINMERKNLDFVVDKVRCKAESSKGDKKQSGGEIKVPMGLTWTPDANCFRDYINSGGHRGVEDILKDMLSGEVSRMANVRTWEQMTFSENDLRALIILKLANNTTEYQEMGEYLDLETNKGSKNIEGIKEKKRRLVNKVLAEALTNGVGRISNLGIKVEILNMKPVELIGKLAETAEEVAIETQEKRKEEIQTDTTVNIGKKYKDVFKVEGEVALEAALVQQGKIRKVIYGGNSGELSKAAAIFTGGNAGSA